MTTMTDVQDQCQPDTCPAWCVGAAEHCDGEHWSHDQEIALSQREPYETGFGTDHLAVSTYTDPELGAPAVSLRHADHYISAITPSEAVAVATALARAAMATVSEHEPAALMRGGSQPPPDREEADPAPGGRPVP
jgi:hypothetical protein